MSGTTTVTELEANVLSAIQGDPNLPWSSFYNGAVGLTPTRLLAKGLVAFNPDPLVPTKVQFATTPAGDAALAAWLAANP